MYIYVGVELKSDKQINRFFELEGLRGIAAVMVVIYHFIMAFYLQSFLGAGSLAPVQHTRIEDNLYANPLMGLVSGTFAVGVFFVLSGFVLSIGYFTTGKVDIIKRLATKRYIRLVFPALASIFICYIVLKLGLSRVQEAAAITQSSNLASIWNVTISFWQAIQDGVYGVFIGGSTSYNLVLWTMTIEFIGSFIVFGSLLLFGSSRYRWIVYAMLLIATFSTWYSGFIIGMIFADLYRSEYIKQKTRNLFLAVPILLMSIYFGGYPYGENFAGTLYAPFGMLPHLHLDYRMIATTIGAAMMVFTVLWCTQFASVLRRRPLSNLGKYTFSLYLTHLPIIYTFTAGFFVFLYPIFGYNKAFLISFFVTIPLIAMTAYLFEKYIDRKSVSFSTHVADIYMGKREFSVPKYLLGIGGYIFWIRSKLQSSRSNPVQSVLEPELEKSLAYNDRF